MPKLTKQKQTTKGMGEIMKKTTFILGRTASGKTHHILSDITKKCQLEPTGAPIIIITPEQMTFHTEYQLLKMNEKNSMIRANALSFNRLAHRIMQEVGGLARYHLDEVGKSMLLKKIMLEKKDELGILKNEITKPGFIKKMDELFSEFKSYQIDPTILKEKLSGITMTNQTKEKIETLADLYVAFNEITLQQYLTTEDYFEMLIKQLAQSETIKTADVYIDGYHTFNPQEIAIITQLSKYAKSLTIALTVDVASVSPLWCATKRTLDELKANLNETTEIIMTCQANFKPAELNHFEQHFMQEEKPFGAEVIEHINLFNATSKRAEIEEIAKQIHHLAYDKQVDFANIAVYGSNPSELQQLFESIFKSHNIPYFLDYKESMMQHPVIYLLHKIFDVFESNWRNDKLFEIFKTGLFVDVSSVAKTIDFKTILINHLEEIDELENHVLANNIKKHHWTSGAAWEHQTYEPIQTDEQIACSEKLITLKNRLALPLIQLETALDSAITVKQKSIAIFEFLEAVQIPKQLLLLTESAKALNDEKLQKQHEQVWGKLIGILEQLVEVASEEVTLTADFVQIFKAGLETLTFATIPATLNAVLIGDINRSRYQLTTNFRDVNAYGVSHGFIMGMNEGVIPGTPKEASLLSEKERQALSAADIILAPSLIQVQKDELFHLYTIIAAIKNGITFSYITENAKEPTYILNMIHQLFSHAKEGKDVSAMKDVTIPLLSQINPTDRVTTKQALFNQTLRGLHEENNHDDESVMSYFKKHDEVLANMIEKASGYVSTHNENLTQEQAVTLYGGDIEASVSRIEMFNKCQFAHFLTHGLKLKERDMFELTVADIGTMYHEALKFISLQLKKNNRSFSDLQPKEIMHLAEDAVLTVIKNNKGLLIMDANAQMRVLKIKLIRVVAKTITAMSFQGRRSGFTESYFELQFAREAKGHKDALWIPTETKQIPVGTGAVNLSLKGVIDRIDIAAVDKKKFVRVVDYKSNVQHLQLDSVFYGQSLQLLTYLDVAINWLGPDVVSGGSLYFHIHNPYVDENKEMLTTDFMADLLTEQSAQFKMTGYLPHRDDVVTISDTQLEDGKSSQVIPVAKLASGKIRKDWSKTVEVDEFDLLRKFVNRSIEEATAKMASGEVAINPESHGGNNPCEWCKFKAVCGFEGSPKYLPKLKDADVLKAIKEKLEEGDAYGDDI